MVAARWYPAGAALAEGGGSGAVSFMQPAPKDRDALVSGVADLSGFAWLRARQDVFSVLFHLSPPPPPPSPPPPPPTRQTPFDWGSRQDYFHSSLTAVRVSG